MALHRNLTGADLHEPKGADTALAGQIYVANGTGGGSWVAASTVLTNAAWTTGDAKLTYKSTPDTSWVIADDGTIGDSSSGATNRANADTQALFTLLWSLPACTISGGKGASAAADYAAHKAITLPKVLGRALAIKSGTANIADTQGADSIILSQAQLPQVQLFFGGTAATITSTSSTPDFLRGVVQTSVFNYDIGGGAILGAIANGTLTNNAVTSSASYTPAGSIITTGGSNFINGGGAPLSIDIRQLTAYINVMVKL